MNTKSTETKISMAQEPLQLLTFLLDNEVFAMDISQVQEVLEYTRVTPVPRTPDFMLGVINLRGSVVPIIDMRQQFEMQVAEITVDTCIIIAEIGIDGESTALGLLADAVKEVIILDIKNISPAPRIGSRIDTNYIMGMGNYEDNFIIILDLPKVFSKDELAQLLNTTPETLPQDNQQPSDSEQLESGNAGG